MSTTQNWLETASSDFDSFTFGLVSQTELDMMKVRYEDDADILSNLQKLGRLFELDAEQIVNSSGVLNLTFDTFYELLPKNSADQLLKYIEKKSVSNNRQTLKKIVFTFKGTYGLQHWFEVKNEFNFDISILE